VGLRQRLCDLRAGVKLGALVVTGVLTAGATAFIGYRGITTVQSDSDAMVRDVASPAIDLGPTATAAARERYRLIEALLYTDQRAIDVTLKIMDEQTRAVRDGIAAFAKAPITAEQRKVLTEQLVHNTTAEEMAKFVQILSSKGQPLTDAVTKSFDTLGARPGGAGQARQGSGDAEVDGDHAARAAPPARARRAVLDRLGHRPHDHPTPRICAAGPHCRRRGRPHRDRRCAVG
jgi:hypothetical protein